MKTKRFRPYLRPRRLPLLALLLASACSDGLGPSGDREPITELPRQLTVAERTVIDASNAFGLELAKAVAASDQRPNVVVSPLSASMALGMTLNGAGSSTFEAMRSTLGFGALSQGEINDSYRDIIDLLIDLDPAVQFEIANAIWANEDIPFHEAFFQSVASAFGATAESRDFADPAALEAINAWVDDHTNGLIDSILDSLDPALAMLLVNAIYLDAPWSLQFDPAETRQEDFTLEGGSSVGVDMMSMSDATVPFTGAAEYTAIELPYGGEAFSMVVVLPAEGMTVRDLFDALDETGWTSLTQSLGEVELGRVGLPKFTLTWDGFLNDALIDMGMGEAFQPGADFTPMSPIGDQLCIDFVRQKTYVEVDERGTRAAAVTGVGIGVTSLPPSFVANRPFAFAIRERLSGTLLFVGLVGDPTAEDPGPEPLVSTCG